MKKRFNKNLIMSGKDEEQFQSIKICWIWEKLIDDDNEKVRDHCHVTGKFRGAAHWSCNMSSCNISQFKRLWHSFEFWWAQQIWCENWCNTK